jgi:sugar phosphate isomerase/epimerase
MARADLGNPGRIFQKYWHLISILMREPLNLVRRFCRISISLFAALLLMSHSLKLSAQDQGIDFVPRVAFGVCTNPANAGMLKSAGFDYLEGSVGRDLMPGKPEADFLSYRILLDTCGMPVIACNGFLPGSLRVTGPDARPDTVLKYAEIAFRRASQIGIRTIVFGSAGSRSIPEGFDREQAAEQFRELLRKMAPLARNYGVRVAIENLQRSECNFINTVGEALGIVREVNDPNIGLLADIFHMMREGESPDILIDAGGSLFHCHIAELKDRTAPGMAGDDFRPYFTALKKSGYRGGISVEGSWKPENLARAAQVLHEQWNTAKNQP